MTKDFRNQGVDTPLAKAAMDGHVAVMKLLLERDDVAANSRNHEHYTPLDLAVLGEHEAVVKLLLKRDEVKADRRDILDAPRAAERSRGRRGKDVVKSIKQHLSCWREVVGIPVSFYTEA